MEEFGRDCCIRVYKEIWLAAIGEKLECDREPQNSCDHYAVAVKNSGVVICHLPRKLSRVCLRVCSLFLRRGGVISCTVTGGRRYSVSRTYTYPCNIFAMGKLHTLKFRTVVAVGKFFQVKNFPNYGNQTTMAAQPCIIKTGLLNNLQKICRHVYILNRH